MNNKTKKNISVEFVKKSGLSTIKVSIQKKVMHKAYKKYVKKTTFLLVHCPENENFTFGEKLIIQGCRPISKSKSHRYIGRVEGAKL